MTQRLKLDKGLDASLIFSSRVIKAPLTSRRTQFPELQQYQPMSPSKLLQKYKHRHNKSQTHLLTQQKTKTKTNDYVKKIIFQNQELNKKIKEFIKYNKFLEKENKQMQQKYYDLKDSFLQLKELFKTMADENGIQITQKYQLGNKKQLKLFDVLLKKATKTLSQSDSEPSIIPMNIEIPQITFSMLQNSNSKTKSKISPFQKPLVTSEIQTQTDLILASSLTLNQQLLRSSPSSNQAELLLKISHLQTAITSLEKTNLQIFTKYERIKSIISGQIKSH